MRLWLTLEEWQGFASETIYAKETGPGLAELENCPVFVGLGYGDELRWASVEDVDDWVDDQVDGGLDPAGPADPDLRADVDELGDDWGVPTAVGVKRRSPRRSLAFMVDADDDVSDKVRDLVAEEFGQQCLDAGAEGAGMVPGFGKICVPEQESGSDAQAWAWMSSQLDLVRARLSGKAAKALASGKVRVQWQFTSVPEMGTGPVPSLRLPAGPVLVEAVSDAARQAEGLFAAGSADDALDLLQASAVRGNPWSLLLLMLECVTAGQWGRALANDYWAQQRDIWQEWPEHLPKDQWEYAVEVAEPLVDAMAEACLLYLDCPSLEPDVLLLAAEFAAQEPGLEGARARALLRAATTGSLNALGACLWEGVLSGDPEQALSLFEMGLLDRSDGTPLTMGDRLAGLPASMVLQHPDVLPVLQEVAAATLAPGADDLANVQANAGLAYAMRGDQVEALRLWELAAAGSFEARLWPAVLRVVNGDAEPSWDLVGPAVPRDVLPDLLDGLQGDCGPWFDRWRQATQAVCSAAT